MNPSQTKKREKKVSHKLAKHKPKSFYSKLPYNHLLGDLLYTVGFWVEYVLVCMARKVCAVAKGIASTTANLFMLVLRPFLLGLITLCEDLTSPFTRLVSGIRHIRELPERFDDIDEQEMRAAKMHYFRSGLRRYSAVVWNAITYILPAIAAAAFIILVRQGLAMRFVLNVQVDGESVGYVASEQVFENAREDVQSRINTARQMLEDAGTVVPDTQWDVSPSYSLAISGRTMTESEIANAILRTASDKIVDGTAVYIDGTLRFVTTDGDHLRAYLERIKAPYEDNMDPDVYTDFAHDIRLLDGVYLQESIMSYSDVITALNEGSGVHTYTAEDGDTVQSIVDKTGVTFDSLAQMNPQLLTLDQEVSAGTELYTGASNAELLQVKVVRRETETVSVPFETQTSESDEYDFGKTVVLQEGADGTEDITYEVTMIDGQVTDRQAVAYNVTVAPTPKIQVRGTKLKNGMVAKVGSGSFVWPVPGYKYVSRWMSSGHRGADICAPYGTPIYASDSGTVVASGWHWSYGNYVEIDHGNGYKTLYAHMSERAVQQGQVVSKMDVIGYVGSTGNSTGNHCHFEMFYNGQLFSAQTLFGGM